MKCIDTTRKLTVLILIFLFAVTAFAAEEIPIQNALGGLSGKVVDIAGKPVPECTFTLEPMIEFEGHLVPADEFQAFVQEPPEEMKRPGKLMAIPRVKTDAEGNFKVSNIQPGFLRISFKPTVNLEQELALADLPEGVEMPPEIREELQRQENRQPVKEFLFIQFGNVTFLNNSEGHDMFQGFTFALKPGMTVENVKITIRTRLRLQGRIVYADGTPLANAEVKFQMLFYNERSNRPSPHTATVDDSTDADGGFTIYRDVPGHYTLAIEYGNLSTGAGPFLLNDKISPDKLVLKLDGNKADVIKPRNPDNLLAAEADIQQPFPLQAENSVWIINPANGHAYKKIQCKNWHDARQRAIKEKAYLVAINDEAEQHWLEVAFGSHSFWIGLTDVEEEGKWQWDGGEPVTYTNWATFEEIPDRLPDTQKDYVILSNWYGTWQTTGPLSPSWNSVRHAVIEKDGVLSIIPATTR